MPSLMSVLLCVAWVMQMCAPRVLSAHAAPRFDWPEVVLVGAGIMLGWVLLGDMLAWWSTSIYAWGFGTPAFAAACGIAFLMWLASSLGKTEVGGVVGLVVVLLVFVLTRLPSGNLWDALIDPWLWLVLQFRGASMLLSLRR
jgi:hypothetical protein